MRRGRRRSTVSDLFLCLGVTYQIKIYVLVSEIYPEITTVH